MTLAQNLPYGARTWVAMGVDAAWTVGEHLQAVQVDLSAGANWQRANGKGKRPDPIDRPADIKKAMDRADRVAAKAEAFLAIHGEPELKRPDPPPTTDRPRDSRGRFVSRRG